MHDTTKETALGEWILRGFRAGFSVSVLIPLRILFVMASSAVFFLLIPGVAIMLGILLLAVVVYAWEAEVIGGSFFNLHSWKSL